MGWHSRSRSAREAPEYGGGERSQRDAGLAPASLDLREDSLRPRERAARNGLLERRERALAIAASSRRPAPRAWRSAWLRARLGGETALDRGVDSGGVARAGPRGPRAGRSRAPAADSRCERGLGERSRGVEPGRRARRPRRAATASRGRRRAPGPAGEAGERGAASPEARAPSRRRRSRRPASRSAGWPAPPRAGPTRPGAARRRRGYCASRADSPSLALVSAT